MTEDTKRRLPMREPEAMSDAKQKPAEKFRLLIVDDEPASMRALCDTLEYEGYETVGFTAPADALVAMREQTFDLLLADLQMPGTNGIDLMKSAQLIDPTLVAIIMTGHGARPCGSCASRKPGSSRTSASAPKNSRSRTASSKRFHSRCRTTCVRHSARYPHLRRRCFPSTSAISRMKANAC
jgi:CheY-like chemotaxis protein